MPIDSRASRVEGLLGGRYRFLEFLGRGGFASVYKVENTVLGRLEAFKLLAEGHPDDQDFARRFRDEARLAASLDHAHIIRIYDFGRVEDAYWYSMQFVGGPTVKSRLGVGGRLPKEEALRIAASVLDALDYVHARGIVHRDIKPDNVILDGRGLPVLMDFGIAKAGGSAVKTQSGYILGTPAYLAPEQVSGRELDGRADVYALGVMLYEMLSGSLPFSATDTIGAVLKRLQEDPEPISRKLTGLGPKLEAVVMKALAREREARYATAGLMKEALDEVLQDLRTTARTAVFEETLLLDGEPDPRAPEAPDPARTKATVAYGFSAGATPSTAVPAERTAAVPPPVAAGRPAAEGGTQAGKGVSSEPPRSRGLVLALAGVGAAGALAAGVLLLRPRSAPPEVLGQGAGTRPVPTSAAVSPAPAATLPPAGVSAPVAAPSLETTVASAPPTPSSNALPAPTSAPVVRLRPGPRESAPEPVAPRKRQPVAPPEVIGDVSILLDEDIRERFRGKHVGLSVIVDESGRVKEAKVLSPLCEPCDRAALEAIRKATFKPAVDAKGAPVEARVVLPLEL